MPWQLCPIYVMYIVPDIVLYGMYLNEVSVLIFKQI